MAKTLAYWHTFGLGFSIIGQKNTESNNKTLCSYVLSSNNVILVITSTYPTNQNSQDSEVASFVSQNYCGVKRVAVKVSSVHETFKKAVANGAIPIKFPSKAADDYGFIEEASIKLYDQNEITFINRENYKGVFKPGYTSLKANLIPQNYLFDVDHIASEVRLNEADHWTQYLSNAVGTKLTQSFGISEDNKTGMVLKVNQSHNNNTTFVIAQPETYNIQSKVQVNIDMYGSGIHHIAFTTINLHETVKELINRGIEFVNVPTSYYDLLRANEEFKNVDIDKLQELGILIDKENDTYLLQKFIKPISERPFFLYEIVERINGYNGFALRNINVLKKAEELEIYKKDI